MIKCTDYVVEGFTADGKTKVRASLFADTSSEVVTNGTDVSNIENISNDSVLTSGTSAMTATGDFGQLDSTGAWHF